jgi:hypothetical protein
LIEHSRSHASVLIECAPNRQQQTVQREIVLQARIADRAQINSVQRPQLIERIRGHHCAMLEIMIGPPGKMSPLELKPEASAGGFEHIDAGGNHFTTDAVSRDHCNAISSHTNKDQLAGGVIMM